MSALHSENSRYFVPAPSWWPLVGSLALLMLAGGFVILLQHQPAGGALMLAGVVALAVMLFGWFGNVIRESLAGRYNGQVDVSYRWGMAWFIFSEVMFFAALFFALIYARFISVPELGNTELLWPGFPGAWPTAGPGLKQSFAPMAAWGIPAINTLLLLSSGATITWAHWGLKSGRRFQLILGIVLTIALGILFLALQFHEYRAATFNFSTGIYGATFYILTGFHGAHVTLGVIMLTVILGRSLAGHFTPDRHFAFEAVSWYWHFVDVVWLLLFVIVYWLV
jgi:cytochrome c oxidase subunit 3